MTDELDVEGVSYVSSKKAAQVSGYAQDYIGQLCRAGSVLAQRIGGLWYVNLDSLYQYKQKADSYTPVAPRVASDEKKSSLVSFDGKDYISTARAAEITGYHKDYVGQLAREGAVLSRQVGNRWYVERNSVHSHKKEKDALLGAVQAEAVGIVRNLSSGASDARQSVYKDANADLMTYTSDNRELIPPLPSDELDIPSPLVREMPKKEADNANLEMPIVNHIPIRIEIPEERIRPLQEKHMPPSRDSYKASSRAFLAVGVATVVIVLAVGGIYIGSRTVLTDQGVTGERMTALSSLAGDIAKTIGELLEGWLVPEMVYKSSIPSR